MAQTPEQKAAAKAEKDAKKAAAAPAETTPDTNSRGSAEPDAVAPAVETPKPSKTAVTVKYRDHLGSETSRTFSKEVHGEDFAKLADEFKATNASRIIE